jgi:hypothetical protein
MNMSEGPVKCLCGKGEFVWSIENGYECEHCGVYWNGQFPLSLNCGKEES